MGLRLLKNKAIKLKFDGDYERIRLFKKSTLNEDCLLTYVPMLLSYTNNS